MSYRFLRWRAMGHLMFVNEMEHSRAAFDWTAKRVGRREAQGAPQPFSSAPCRLKRNGEARVGQSPFCGPRPGHQQS